MSIETAIARSEERLMRLPNVTGIGIGKKRNRKVIKVFVTRKVPESSLRPEEVVPKTLEGYSTDVEETGDLLASHR
jgi:hypothetical protein